MNEMNPAVDMIAAICATIDIINMYRRQSANRSTSWTDAQTGRNKKVDGDPGGENSWKEIDGVRIDDTSKETAFIEHCDLDAQESNVQANADDGRSNRNRGR